ncbi:MAG: threonine synthase [Halanaerobiales bacterium]
MNDLNVRHLRSTINENEYEFSRLREWDDNGDALEVVIPGIVKAKIRSGKSIYDRFRDFIPFKKFDFSLRLGEGETPLLEAAPLLKEYCEQDFLFLKDETQNPTWSFKDRGSLTTIWMAQEMEERVTATISTGNVGHSISAYGARASQAVVVFVPGFTPREKLKAMAIHNPIIIRVDASDYSKMKKRILDLGLEYNLRIVSGNGPIRVEGYKFTAFELYEQFGGEIPDYIAVPTSACGHIRGIFKGFRELKTAGYINNLPKMIVVQAKNNSPVVSAINKNKDEIIPFADIKTVAEAISSGNPFGGKEIINKARYHGWPAAAISEEEILESQRKLAEAGHFVEASSATSLAAVKNLKKQGKIKNDDSVVIMLTGAGFKDLSVLSEQEKDIDFSPFDTDLEHLAPGLEWALNKVNS